MPANGLHIQTSKLICQFKASGVPIELSAKRGHDFAQFFLNLACVMKFILILTNSLEGVCFVFAFLVDSGALLMARTVVMLVCLQNTFLILISI